MAQGHDVGKVDGLVGFKTRQTIGEEEKKLGLPLTCYPSSSRGQPGAQGGPELTRIYLGRVDCLGFARAGC